MAGPEQPLLLPEEPLDVERLEVRLADLPPDQDLLGPAPDAALASSVRRLGVLQPILVARGADGTLRVVEGRRRIKAARAAGHATVPAIVATLSGAAPMALTLLVHASLGPAGTLEAEDIERVVAALVSVLDEATPLLALVGAAILLERVGVGLFRRRFGPPARARPAPGPVLSPGLAASRGPSGRTVAGAASITSASPPP